MAKYHLGLLARKRPTPVCADSFVHYSKFQFVLQAVYNHDYCSIPEIAKEYSNDYHGGEE
jgi:hypothetical protein